jgi:hypothetical protein
MACPPFFDSEVFLGNQTRLFRVEFMDWRGLYAKADSAALNPMGGKAGVCGLEL